MVRRWKGSLKRFEVLKRFFLAAFGLHGASEHIVISIFVFFLYITSVSELENQRERGLLRSNMEEFIGRLSVFCPNIAEGFVMGQLSEETV